MIIAAIRHPLRSVSAVAVGVACLLGGAQAQTADSPTTVSAVPNVQKGTVGRQLWRISDYTTVELVAREPGARDNQHPWQVDSHALYQQLQQVQVVRGGKPRPLFATGVAADELAPLAESLAEAFANARPDQDVAVISAARHDDNTFWSISAVTARLFFVDGHLNLIVHDARYDFYDTARGTGMAPHFSVGSRKDPGRDTLVAANSTNTRADWLVLGTVTAPPAVVAPVPVAPPAVVAPAAPIAPAVVAPAAVAPAVVVPVAPPAPAAVPDVEQRLTTLKRLYDKGLITKSEYESKRAEILKGL